MGERKQKHKKSVSHLLFRFGMTGCFKFTKNNDEEVPKHAHLRFITKDGKHLLSFVDYRRFGKWVINGEWGKDRGPDPISNYEVILQYQINEQLNVRVRKVLKNPLPNYTL